MSRLSGFQGLIMAVRGFTRQSCMLRGQSHADSPGLLRLSLGGVAAALQVMPRLFS